MTLSIPITVDLNADVGEGIGNDPLLFPIITSANICCGAHAGSLESIREALTLAKEYGVVVGAHPGFADRENFGRRILELPLDALTDLVQTQVELLRSEAALLGLRVGYLKPHGGLFHLAHRDTPTAEALVQLAEKYNLALVGLPNSLLHIMGKNRVPVISEGYADRAYTEDGNLVPRNQPNAIIHSFEESFDQVLKLISQGVQTICVHGDHPEAVTLALNLRKRLEEQGVSVRAFL